MAKQVPHIIWILVNRGVDSENAFRVNYAKQYPPFSDVRTHCFRNTFGSTLAGQSPRGVETNTRVMIVKSHSCFKSIVMSSFTEVMSCSLQQNPKSIITLCLSESVPSSVETDSFSLEAWKSKIDVLPLSRGYKNRCNLYRAQSRSKPLLHGQI